MGEGREQSIPTREEASFKIGERHAKRVIATVKNYVAQCRSLEEKGDRLPSALRSLQRQKEATLSVLRRELNVEEGWLTHDGATPEWLKLVDDSQKIIAAVVAEQGGIPERSYVERLDNANQAFLGGVIFEVPSSSRENDQLLGDLRTKYETAQFKRNLAKAVINRFRDLF